MAKAVKLSQIEAQINLLHHNVSKIAAWHRNNSDHYTPQGIQAKYAAALEDQRFNYRGRAQQLAQVIDQLEPAAEAKATQARAALLPTATDPTERLAAELEAQRLMSRPNLDQPAILNLIQNAEPSPGLTLAMEEWQARGILEDQYVEAALSSKSPELHQAQTDTTRARTMAGMLRQRLAKAEEQMTTTQPVDTEYTPSVTVAINEGWAESAEVESVPSGAFSEITVDPVYRSA